MEENIQTHWSLRLALFGIEKFLILLLSVFDIFCLIFILTVWILRFRAGQIRKRRFRAETTEVQSVPWQDMQNFSTAMDRNFIHRRQERRIKRYP